MRSPILALFAGVLVAPLLVATASTLPTGATSCHPFDTPPEYAGDVPTPEQVLGFPLGQREVTVAESDEYLLAVDAASDEVSSGVAARSHQGRPLRYAVVGAPEDVAAARRAAGVLRDPRTTPADAAEVAAEAPAIAWVAGNVHGDEESGADAALRVLRNLADRTDCAATQIRDNTVVVVLPSQNPDGREMDTRRNAYGFDLNRDWFARTQPETDGKVETLLEYPGVLFIDDHEMGADDFFFPPNADPAHHEIADRSIRWINDLYGASMATHFDEQGIPYFNYDIYDLLYMGYGDTVPTTGLLGAGMTFEKNNAEPIGVRLREQYVAVWSSLTALALDKTDVLTGWAASHRQALAQGRGGVLEPNRVWAPGNEVEREVPDETVRHYFVEPPAKAKADEVRSLIRRLQRMGVEVRTLTQPLRVPDYRPYGAGSRARTLAAGSYWIPMAQADKHWVQAMLGEDSYVPFPYFYDVTAWSGPLLFNIAAGRSGAVLQPRSRVTPMMTEPAPPRRPAGAGAVGLWTLDDGTAAYESSGWMRWLFDHKWRIPYRQLTSADIAEGGLAPIDVLVAPNGDAATAFTDLGPAGRRALRQWLADGGRFVGIRGGTELAARLQLTTARLASPKSDVPGSLIRAEVADGPLRVGVGRTVWNFYEYDPVMRVNDPSTAAVSYPAADSPAWFVSGFERGAAELATTAAVVDEPYGAGRVVVFASEPNFRAFTDGTQQLLWNAMFRSDPVRSAPVADARARRSAAADAAEGLVRLDDRLVVTLRTGAEEEEAVGVLGSYGLAPARQRVADGVVRYVVPARTAERSAVVRSIVADLAALGPGVLAVRVP